MFSLGEFTFSFEQKRGNIEMVDWIGQVSLLLKRLKDSWMDLLPLSAMTQEKRESHYQADMTQFNAERRNRNEAVLDPCQQGKSISIQ